MPRQNQFRHDIGATCVAADETGDFVGFATVAASEITTVGLAASKKKRLPAYPLPVLLHRCHLDNTTDIQ